MEIKKVNRPWQKDSRPRYNPDPFYQSKGWKQIRTSFREGFTIVNGFKLSNKFCVDCYKETGKQIPGSNTDHIVARKLGGGDEHSNLQTQCDRHHASKSANEGKF